MYCCSIMRMLNFTLFILCLCCLYFYLRCITGRGAHTPWFLWLCLSCLRIIFLISRFVRWHFTHSFLRLNLCLWGFVHARCVRHSALWLCLQCIAVHTALLRRKFLSVFVAPLAVIVPTIVIVIIIIERINFFIIFCFYGLVRDRGYTCLFLFLMQRYAFSRCRQKCFS